MNRAVQKSAIVTVIAVIGSAVISLAGNLLFAVEDMTVSLTLAFVCPLILSPPISYWNFRQAELVAQLHRQLEQAHQDLSHTMERLKESVRRDGMTGLLSRTAFFEAAEPLCLKVGGALVMIDADHFKQINDLYGHSAGDATLIMIAKVISSASVEEMLAARVGGEEFVIFIPSGTEEDAEIVAENIRRSVENFSIKDAQFGFRSTVSLGIAESLPGATLNSLYRAADEALYRSKRAGRNRISHFGVKIAA